MHATDFWATDVRKVWGKSRMRAIYIPDARNPFNPENLEGMERGIGNLKEFCAVTKRKRRPAGGWLQTRSVTVQDSFLSPT